MLIYKKLTLIIIILAVIPIFLIGIFSFYHTRHALIQAQLQSLETITDLKINRMESFFKERKGNMAIALGYTDIRVNLPVLTAMNNIPGSSDYKEAFNKIDALLKPLQNVYGFVNILLMDLQGNVVYKSNESSGDIESITLLKMGIASPVEGDKGIKIQQIYQENKKYEIFITGPVLGTNEESLEGLMTFQVDMSPLYDLVQDTTGLGQTGETLIGKLIGDNAVFFNPLRHDLNAALKRKVSLGSPLAFPIQQAVQGRHGLGVSRDYRDEEVIAAWRYIPSLELGLVAKIDSKEAFSSINVLSKLIVLFIIVTLLFTIGIAVIFAKSITEPIRSLKKGVELIGTGNQLDYRVGTNANDEIGQLSRAFDEMAENLKKVTASRDELNREVAQRKRIEESLRKLTAEFARSNKELEQFAYVASHDLQEPLRMVASFTDLLARRYKGKLGKDADEFISYAQDGAGRMQNMIHDLLMFSRVGTHGRDFNSVNAEGSLKKALSNLEKPIEESNADISWDPLPCVMADETQFIQLLQNLISNAIKYRSDMPPKIHIGAEKVQNGQRRFFVKDNGIGISPEHKERIFVIFQRLHSLSTYPGTGIGLAICKKIVERHGGSIWVESEPGKGSTFYFTFPEANT